VPYSCSSYFGTKPSFDDVPCNILGRDETRLFIVERWNLEPCENGRKKAAELSRRGITDEGQFHYGVIGEPFSK